MSLPNDKNNGAKDLLTPAARNAIHCRDENGFMAFLFPHVNRAIQKFAKGEGDRDEWEDCSFDAIESIKKAWFKKAAAGDVPELWKSYVYVVVRSKYRDRQRKRPQEKNPARLFLDLRGIGISPSEREAEKHQGLGFEASYSIAMRQSQAEAEYVSPIDIALQRQIYSQALAMLPEAEKSLLLQFRKYLREVEEAGVEKGDPATQLKHIRARAETKMADALGVNKHTFTGRSGPLTKARRRFFQALEQLEQEGAAQIAAENEVQL